MDKETYYAALACSNCGKADDFYIGKGMSVKDYTEITECENCGCKTLGPEN